MENPDPSKESPHSADDLFIAFLEMSWEPAVILSDTGKICKANNPFLKQLGYTGNETESHHLINFCFNAESENILEKLLKMNSPSKTRNSVSLNLRTKTGKKGRYQIDFRYSGINKDEKSILMIFHNLDKDMNDTKTSSDAEKYLEIANVMFITLDTHQKVTMINKKGCSLLGYRREEIIGKDWSTTFLPPENKSSVKELFSDILSGKYPASSNNENTIICKSGQRKLISWYNTLLYDDTGKINGILTTGEDITQKHEAEKKIREYSEWLSLATQSASLGIWDKNMITEEVVWDKKMYELFGLSYGKDRIDKNTWEKLVHPDDREEADFKLERALSGDAPYYRSHFRIILKDNSFRYLEASAMVQFDEQQKPKRIIGVNWDNTEQYELLEENAHLQKQFYQSQKMESIGQLAGGIAHDFNNLLVPIIGYAELGISATNEDSELHESFYEIEKAGSRAAELTRQILAFSRRQVLETKLVNLNQIITGFKKMISILIGEDIRLEFELAPRLLSVKADRSQIEQILLNLAINARDAIKSDGLIKIRTENLRLTKDRNLEKSRIPKGEYSIVTLEDNGIGMDSHIQDYIFEPFYTTKPRERGTGLGLSIVFGITKQHGGYIEVESTPGKGSCFTLYFPSRKEAVSELSVDGIKIEDNKSRKESYSIIVVEDDDSVREFICQILRKKGFSVIESDNGDSALTIASTLKKPLHLLLTDIILPGIDGRELSKKMQIHQKGLKTLFMSGYAKNLIKPDQLIPGIEAYIHKPFRSDELIITIHKLLNN